MSNTETTYYNVSDTRPIEIKPDLNYILENYKKSKLLSVVKKEFDIKKNTFDDNTFQILEMGFFLFFVKLCGDFSGQEIVKITKDPSIYIIGNFGTEYNVHIEIYSEDSDKDNIRCSLSMYLKGELIANEFGLLDKILENLKFFINKTKLVTDVRDTYENSQPNYSFVPKVAFS